MTSILYRSPSYTTPAKQEPFTQCPLEAVVGEKDPKSPDAGYDLSHPSPQPEHEEEMVGGKRRKKKHPPTERKVGKERKERGHMDYCLNCRDLPACPAPGGISTAPGAIKAIPPLAKWAFASLITFFVVLFLA